MALEHVLKKFMLFTDRDMRLIENCKSYAANDPAGLPGHNTNLIVARLSILADELIEMLPAEAVNQAIETAYGKYNGNNH